MKKHKHGGDIYSRNIEMDYSANISPLGIPKRSEEAILASLDRLVHYPDVECRSLRAMLSEKEGIPADFILCGNGAAELIFALANGLKPKRALVAAPGFAEYEQALSGAGCELSFYELKEAQGLPIRRITFRTSRKSWIWFSCAIRIIPQEELWIGRF